MSLYHAAIYVRVSTRDQAEEGLSIDSQPAQVLAQLNAVLGEGRFTYEIFVDEGKSGGLGPMPWASTRKARERKGLWEMIQKLQAGEFTHVAAFRIDRIYRDRLGLLGLYKEVMQPRGIKFIFVKDSFDDSLSGRLTQGMLAEIAEFQREQNSENIRETLAFRREQGYYLGTIPFGWRIEEPHEYEGRRRNIRPVPEEGAVVKRVVDLYLSGMSEQAIARKLNAENVPHKKSSGNWRSNTVHLVLVNPTHAGLVRGPEGKLIPGIHFGDRYYDEPVLAQVMSRLERNRRRLKGTNHTQPFRLFSGVAACGHCGKRLQGSFHTNNPGYRCLGRVESSDGSHVYISAAQLENLVVSELAGLAREPEVLEAIEAEIEALVRSQDESLSSRAREVSSALSSLAQQEDQLVDAHAKKIFSVEVVKRRMNMIDEEKTSLSAEMIQIEKVLSSSANRAEIIRQAKAALHRFDAIWDQMTDSERREALHLSISELKVFASENRKWIELKLVFRDEPIEIEVLRGAERYRVGKPAGPASLTPRELAALKHVLDGANYVQIAKYFDSTPTNAHALLRRAVQKLGAKSVVEAADMAAGMIRKLQSQLPLFGRVEAPKHVPKRLMMSEYQVLQFSAEGKSVSEIALHTRISVERVRDYLRTGLAKCGLKSVKAAVKKLSQDDSLLPVTMINRRRIG